MRKDGKQSEGRRRDVTAVQARLRGSVSRHKPPHFTKATFYMLEVLYYIQCTRHDFLLPHARFISSVEREAKA